MVRKMIKFAICDDDCEYMSSVVQVICATFDKYKTFDDVCDCVLYHSGDELLENFEKDKIDIFFLDIECGEQSGFDIARELIKRKRDLGIVYITNHKHYVSKAFVCRPLGFVCKHDIENDLIFPMTNIIEFLEEKRQILVLNSSKGDLSLLVSDIVIVEVFKRELHITMTDRVLEFPGSLSKYEHLLEKSGFIKVARGILVNKRFIIKVYGNMVYLINGLKCPISRRKVMEVRQVGENLEYNKI